MTRRELTTALLFTTVVMGCSSRLPAPTTPAPTPTDAPPQASTAAPCHAWDRVGPHVQWTIDHCWDVPAVTHDPPPLHLTHNLWSGGGRLLATEHAPWKKAAEGKKESPQAGGEQRSTTKPTPPPQRGG